MKQKLLFLMAIVSVFLLGCNKSNNPSTVAEEFYNHLNKGEVEKAKELASPSAKDYIDKLSTLGVFSKKGDTIKFEVMDVKKVEEPKEGDSSFVNYKIGQFKSKIALVFIEKKWKVVFSDDLKKLRIIEFNSMDILSEIGKNNDVFKDNYNGCRIRVKYLIYGYKKDEGIGYNPNSNTISIENKSYLCGKELTNLNGFVYSSIAFKSFIASSDLSKLTEDIGTSNFIANVGMVFDFHTTFDLEGIYSNYYAFTDCQSLNVKTCKNMTTGSVKPNEVKKTTEGKPDETKTKLLLMGTWKGPFSKKTMELIIDKVENNNASGYDILNGKKRPFTGTYNDNGSTYNLTLNEPGDDKGDGKFVISINKSSSVLTGYWQQFKGSSRYDFTFNKNK